MEFRPANLISLLSFSFIVSFVVLAFLGATAFVELQKGHQPRKKVLLTAAGLLLWMAFFSSFAWTGLLRSFPFPGIPLFFAAMNIGALVFVFSKQGKEFAKYLPVSALVGFQVFRLPLELVLHSWVQQGAIPETMTWTGQNWDLVSGLMALLLFPFSKKSNAIAWTANIIGFALLLNVFRVAVMSSPLPFAWQVEPPLQLALYFPYVLIGPVCVSGALVGHLLLTRKLLSSSQLSSSVD